MLRRYPDAAVDAGGDKGQAGLFQATGNVSEREREAGRGEREQERERARERERQGEDG